MILRKRSPTIEFMGLSPFERQLLQQCTAKLEQTQQSISDVRQLLDSLGAAVPAPPAPVAPQPRDPREPRAAETPKAPAQPEKLGAPIQPIPAPRPLPPPRPWWSDEKKVIRVIATLGTIITVIGVFLLVALAIQRGLLGPLGRVLLSFVFAALIGGIGIRLHSRKAHPAAVGAFLSTSLLTAMLTVYALAVILHWWPEYLGSFALVALVIAYLTLTARWNAPSLCTTLGVGASIIGCIYFIAATDTFGASILPCTLIPLILGAVAYLKGWTKVLDIAGGTAIIALLISETTSLAGSPPLIPTPVLSVVTALVFVAFTLDSRRITRDGFNTVVLPAAAFIIGAVAWNEPQHYDIISWVFVLGALIMIGFSLRVRSFELMQFTSALLALSFLPVYGAAPSVGLYSRALVVCVFLIAASLATLWMTWHRVFSPWAWLLWVVSALLMTLPLTGASISGTQTASGDAWNIAQAIAIAGLICMAVSRRAQLSALPGMVQLILAAAGLHLSMLAIVTIGSHIGAILNNPKGGFLFGHAAVSVFWMGLACYVLLALRGVSRQAALPVGLVLACAAIGKLVFFDLSALHGVSRVTAFFISGALLLTIAGLRSRQQPQPASAPAAQAAPQATGGEPDAGTHTGAVTQKVHPVAPGQSPMLEDTPLPTMHDEGEGSTQALRDPAQEPKPRLPPSQPGEKGSD